MNYPFDEIVAGYVTRCYCTFYARTFARLNKIIRIHDDICLCVHLVAVFLIVLIGPTKP